MAPHRRGRLITIQELLDIQRESVPPRCERCRRDATDRDHELVHAALRARIRALESRVSDLEVMLSGAS
ncbi:MAG TPA: hypothetical protein VGD80_41650 [Kofleriaceae bacterium]